MKLRNYVKCFRKYFTPASAQNWIKRFKDPPHTSHSVLLSLQIQFAIFYSIYRHPFINCVSYRTKLISEWNLAELYLYQAIYHMSMIWYFFLKLNDKINCAHILVGSYDLLDRRINDVTINNILVVFFIIHSKEIPCYRWSVQLKITVPHLAAPRVPLLFFVIYYYWPEARYAESIFYFDLRYLGVVTTRCYSSMQFLILYKVSRPSLLVCG